GPCGSPGAGWGARGPSVAPSPPSVGGAAWQIWAVTVVPCCTAVPGLGLWPTTRPLRDGSQSVVVSGRKARLRFCTALWAPLSVRLSRFGTSTVGGPEDTISVTVAPRGSGVPAGGSVP